jgi:hypothetical protein
VSIVVQPAAGIDSPGVLASTFLGIATERFRVAGELVLFGGASDHRKLAVVSFSDDLSETSFETDLNDAGVAGQRAYIESVGTIHAETTDSAFVGGLVVERNPLVSLAVVERGTPLFAWLEGTADEDSGTNAESVFRANVELVLVDEWSRA